MQHATDSDARGAPPREATLPPAAHVRSRHGRGKVGHLFEMPAIFTKIRSYSPKKKSNKNNPLWCICLYLNKQRGFFKWPDFDKRPCFTFQSQLYGS